MGPSRRLVAIGQSRRFRIRALSGFGILDAIDEVGE